MAAYCTLDDLVARFSLDEIISAADRDGDGVPDQGVVDAAIADASAEIDVRLAARYRVPFTRATRILRNLACDLARYELFQSRPHEEALRRRTAAIDLLDAIAAGDISLGPDEIEAQPEGQAKTRISVQAPPSAFPPSEQEAFMGRLR